MYAERRDEKKGKRRKGREGCGAREKGGTYPRKLMYGRVSKCVL